jgi:hypothetical protein
MWDWGSFLAVGMTKEIVFWIWCLWDLLGVEGRTEPKFGKILRWSFATLFHGCWPHQDWEGTLYVPGTPEFDKAGTPLVGNNRADSLFCVLWKLKSDGEWNHKESLLIHNGIH